MKKFLTTSAAMILAAVLLNGCAIGASPAVADDAAVSTIQIGQTTKQDVLAKFGTPSDESNDDKGNSSFHYQRVQTSALAFIPGLNMLGKSEHDSEITVHFNKKGIVTGLDRANRNL